MHQKERINCIADILKKNGYVTVKYLTEQLHYSNATINRDLNIMEGQKLIKRSYGGVELIKSKGVPLFFRYHKMRPAKNKIGKRAAELVKDGDVIFIDGSTTAQCIVKYLTDKNDITVITNNIAVVSYLSEYNISVICLGGKVVETPSMLSGIETVENAKRYRADKMFFSTAVFTSEGKISSGDTYHLLHKQMAQNSDKVYYLADHQKADRPYKLCFGDLSDVDGIITDFKFSGEVKAKFALTEFIEV